MGAPTTDCSYAAREQLSMYDNRCSGMWPQLSSTRYESQCLINVKLPQVPRNSTVTCNCPHET